MRVTAVNRAAVVLLVGSVVALIALIVIIDYPPGVERGSGDPADLRLANTDLIEVREVPVIGGWSPDERTARGIEPGALVHEIRDPAQIAPIIAALADAHYIDPGNVVWSLPPPDYEVVFLSGDVVLQRLGYFREAGRWGQHPVEGRWFKDWRPLAVTVELPPDPLARRDEGLRNEELPRTASAMPASRSIQSSHGM
jgi:hypothetical protein